MGSGASGKYAAPAPSAGAVAVGLRVRLQGLEAKPQLNGLEGVCKAEAAGTGRWNIALDSGREVAVRTCNLVPLVGLQSSVAGKAAPIGALPFCQKGCGRRTHFAVKPSGFAHETCCKGCSEGKAHEVQCQEGVDSDNREATPLSADGESVEAAVALFQALARESGCLGHRELDIAVRVLQDRLHVWPEWLRCFNLQAVVFPELQQVGGSGCPWIAHLAAYYAELGRKEFRVVCKCQAQGVKAKTFAESVVLAGSLNGKRRYKRGGSASLVPQAFQSFWRQKGARILDKGLKAGDSLQIHALGVVQSVWGNVIHRAYSQEYLDRGATRILHSGTLSDYTPPSCGPITSTYWTQSLGISEDRATADIERVVRVALTNKEAVFDGAHVPLYHGLAAVTFASWAKSGPAFQSYPGKFGDGIYLTPSFQMACMYAFRQPRTMAVAAETGLAAPRFAAAPDGRWNYLVCLQVMASAAAIEKFKGTAFTDAGDGWDLEAQISIVRDATQAQIYGVLFCYFPRTFRD